MAKVLFLLQLIVALIVLPLWPGLDPQYAVWGLTFLGVVVIVPFAVVTGAYGAGSALKAFTEVWSPVPLGAASRPTAQAWSLAAEVFPAAGILGGLIALTGPLLGLDPGRSLAPQILLLVFFSLVWGLLGLLVGRVLQQNAVRLTQIPAPFLVLTPAFSRRFGLTPRETEAAQAILDGLTYQGAADKLFVSQATVKSHILSVYEKTGMGNKIELLRLVERQSAVPSPS